MLWRNCFTVSFLRSLVDVGVAREESQPAFADVFAEQVHRRVEPLVVEVPKHRERPLQVFISNETTGEEKRQFHIRTVQV